MRPLLRFIGRVFADFRKNQGMLLSGALAYNTLLSIVPLFVVLLVALSHIVDAESLLEQIAGNLALVLPRAQAQAITDEAARFIASRAVIGGVSMIVLLFFSSIAFTVLENAMSVIFFHRVAIKRRHFLVSAIIPYAFIMALGAGLLVITIISGALEVVGSDTVRILGREWSVAGASGVLLYLLGVCGLALMLTALYLVMPVGRIAVRHALVGGITATALWELVRHALVWYFSKLSMVNVVYGSLATSVVVLLTLEVASLIILIGAQVIAEFERSAAPSPTTTTPTTTPRLPDDPGTLHTG